MQFWEVGLTQGTTIVVDIGKTLAKVSLWSADGRMLNRQARPNTGPVEGGIARLDADGIAAWLPKAMARYADHPVGAVVPGNAKIDAASRYANSARIAPNSGPGVRGPSSARPARGRRPSCRNRRRPEQTT